VNLVDEQDVMRLEVGQDRGQVAGLFQHRPRSLAQVDLHFVGDDMRQGGLAQARRAEYEYMVERFAAFDRGLDEYFHLLAHFLLADIVGQQPGPQGAVLG